MNENQPANSKMERKPSAESCGEVDNDQSEIGDAEDEDGDDQIFESNGDAKTGHSTNTVEKRLDGKDHTSHADLDVFRQQWQEELQQRPGSRGQSPRNNINEATNVSNKSKQAADIENEARAFFMQGMEAEDDGMFNEAIFYYRKALQLVPDIESRLGNVTNKSPRERVRQDSEGSVEESEFEDGDLLLHLEQLKLKEEGLCHPEYEQRMTHISCLPVELIVYILHWVVSNDLDLRSLEMFSLVCRGFYLCARDERVWRKACQRVWGVNLGSTKKYGGSWRKMLIDRPHLLFDGCYISKVTYVRQGEQGMDSFYRPFHLVEYFRYVRFFPDGQMLMLVSPEDPLQSLPKLRYRNSKAAGILKGGYRLSDYKVTCVLRRVKSEPVNNYRYRRHRQAANQNDLEMIYSVEFEVVSNGRKRNAQLVWGSYAIRSVHLSTGEEATNSFDLNKRAFPPLIFSRVRSYNAASVEPLV